VTLLTGNSPLAPGVESSMASLLASELTRQTERLVSLGLPALADLSPDEFRALVEPLRAPLERAVVGEPTTTPAHASFALVVNRTLVPVSARVGLVEYAGRPGTLNRHFADVDTFEPVVEVPDAPVYAIVDVERGDEFCGVTPTAAAAAIATRGRSPLTIDEGLGLLHAVPTALERNRCFHTGASRGTDRRVPAFWISQEAPTLGWCWERNHHTWLGYASAATRLAP
jgi:hypothetical protein